MLKKQGILHVDTERGWRGGQQQAIYLFEELLKRGYKTHFICRHNSKLKDYLKDKLLPFHTELLATEFDFYSGWKIAKFAKKYDYKIIQLHSGHALSIGIYAKFFYRQLKIIGSRRVDFTINKNWLSHLKYTNCFIDRIIAISDNIKKVLISDGLNPDKIKMIRSGINIHKFDNIISDPNLKIKLGLPKDSLVVGTVAALVGHKDYPNLLKAAEVVIKQMHNVYFIAAGDGKDCLEIKKIANKLDLDNRFHFLGYRTDIGELLKIMDVFVLASHKEGLGTSTLDAMSAGLPVIGTKAGGIPEVIRDNYNGYLVPKKSFKELADAIIKLAIDKKKRDVFGINSLIKVKEYDIQKTIDATVKLYQELI